MTWALLLEIWLICGVTSAVWHVIDEWWQHKVFEHRLSDVIFQDLILIALCLLTGPIGLAIKLWEKFFDPTNI